MRRLLLPIAAALALAPAGLAATFSFALVTSSPLAVPTVTLNGVDQTQTVSVVTYVSYTGGGNTAGWKVQASAGVPASGASTLPALQVTDGSSACYSSCQTDATETGVSYPLTLSSTPQTIYNAARNTGRGVFAVTSSVLLSYPARTLVGTYATTLTLSGTTGP